MKFFKTNFFLPPLQQPSSFFNKAELKKKSPEEVLENFLKAQKQVFAITKAEVEGKITPITKDETWDEGTKNKVYKETLKKLGFKDDEIIFSTASDSSTRTPAQYGQP